MKKTKIAAIVACAALLVLGMAFTAMAANKWVFQNGGWYAVDKDGEPVEYVWVAGQDGVKYWADEDGLWAVNAWVDDGEIYVGADGKKASGWLKLANEDEDVDTYGDYSWYYFTNGKAKAETVNDDGVSTAALIEGARYCFDDTCRMMYGWINTANEMFDPDEDEFKDAKYYCGGEDEGWAVTGWQNLYGTDGTDAEDSPYYWFYFSSKGVLFDEATQGLDWTEKKTIDGLKYTFDDDGRMLTGWVPASVHTPASTSYAQDNGSAIKKGWVWTTSTDGQTGTYDDGETNHWFWFNNSGVLVADTLTNANKSKTTWFALDKEGVMLSGLYQATATTAIYTAGDTALGIREAGLEIPAYSDHIDEAPALLTGNQYYFYFGDEVTDGSMKTGDQTITLDGEDYTIRFSKGAKDKYYVSSTQICYVPGASVTGYQSGKFYVAGQLLCGGNADKDTTYSFVSATIDSEGKYVLPDYNADGLIEESAPGSNGTEYGNGYYEVDTANLCVVTDAGKILKSGTVKDDEGNKWKIVGYEVVAIKPAE